MQTIERGSSESDCSLEKLTEDLLAAMGKMARGMGAMFRREMERFGVTWPQFYALKFVKNTKGITVTELSNRMMISPPTASKMIDGLCARGLLDKRKDDSDQRVSRLRLTSKSRRLLKALSHRQERVMSEVLKEEDYRELERTVKHLRSITDRWFEMSRNI